ncbi:MAG: terminase TerL endonuclease subunit [Veillonellales bacterium]
MTLREELIQYSHDTIDGKIVACQKHKWACMRFLRDLERENTDEFPYVFNPVLVVDDSDFQPADRFLDWMRLFKHRKGVLKGQYIEPHIIQKFVFGNIYGWIHRDTGYRRFTKAYWQVGRKNAKSQSLSCVGSYELAALGEGASEVYCAGTKTEQAKIVWKETDAMIAGCPELKGKFKTTYGEIVHLKTDSRMRALSKEDQRTGDGLNPQCGIIDEYHAHPTSDMYDIIDSGMGARPQPLIMIITTAGRNLSYPCYSVEYHLVSKILNPAMSFNADNYFVMINELDKDEEGNLIDDVRDEACWQKANPILCSYPEGIKYIRDRLTLALEAPEKMIDWLTKNMDVWVNQRAGGYMNMEKWAACKGDIPDLKGRECYVGVDLSAKIDLTSVAFDFPPIGEDDPYVLLGHSFMPADTLEAKRKTDKVSYDLWIEQEWITATDGAVIDYRKVKKYITETAKEKGWIIKEVCFDPYNATQISQDLQDEGYVCVEIRQGYQTLSEPTKDLREQVYSKNLLHDGNPVLEWAASNAVTRKDTNENIMLDKSKSIERIDPIASSVNAHVRAMIKQAYVYETRGMRSL